jgi:hypothetical protein
MAMEVYIRAHIMKGDHTSYSMTIKLVIDSTFCETKQNREKYDKPSHKLNSTNVISEKYNWKIHIEKS